MKKSLIIVLFFLTLYQVHAQNNLHNGVIVPDSVLNKLKILYEDGVLEGNVNLGCNITNLINHKDKKFKDGIYSFKGSGSHFSYRVFIFRNGKLFVFSSNYIVDFLSEYIECIKILDIPPKLSITYLKVISSYLDDVEE